MNPTVKKVEFLKPVNALLHEHTIEIIEKEIPSFHQKWTGLEIAIIIEEKTTATCYCILGQKIRVWVVLKISSILSRLHDRKTTFENWKKKRILKTKDR